MKHRSVRCLLLAATVAVGPAFSAQPASAGPSVEFSPNPIDFGYCTPGYAYFRTVTVTNTGGSELVITADHLYKGNAPFYINSDGCVGRKVAPGGSCAIQVDFGPTDPSYSAIPSYLVLFDNASGGYQGVLMYGRDEPK